MSITGKISYFAANGDTVELPYLIYPEGYKNRKPYGKGFIDVSLSAGATRSLLEAMIGKYDLSQSLMGSGAAWYLTSRKMERLLKRFGKLLVR